MAKRLSRRKNTLKRNSLKRKSLRRKKIRGGRPERSKKKNNKWPFMMKSTCEREKEREKERVKERVTKEMVDAFANLSHPLKERMKNIQKILHKNHASAFLMFPKLAPLIHPDETVQHLGTA